MTQDAQEMVDLMRETITRSMARKLEKRTKGLWHYSRRTFKTLFGMLWKGKMKTKEAPKHPSIYGARVEMKRSKYGRLGRIKHQVEARKKPYRPAGGYPFHHGRALDEITT